MILVFTPLTMGCPGLVIFLKPILTQMQLYLWPFVLKIIPAHRTRTPNCT
uniref:Uncharacterized protein n=1 Tax=Arundo donax TaxID=35708 RepID=A0A0A9BT06_ARUDO